MRLIEGVQNRCGRVGSGLSFRWDEGSNLRFPPAASLSPQETEAIGDEKPATLAAGFAGDGWGREKGTSRLAHRDSSPNSL